MDLPLEIPTLAEPYQQGLIVCASLISVDDALFDKYKNTRLIFALGDGQDRRFCRLIIGGKGNKKKHFHFDIVRGFTPEPAQITDSEQRAREIIASFSGKKLAAAVHSRFEVPLTELPARGMIRAGMFKVKHAEAAEIEQTSAEFRLSGSPLERIKWSYDPEEPSENRKIMIELELTSELVIEKSYLTLAREKSVAVFRSSIIAGPTVIKYATE
jgi:hypothetical protein